MEKLITVSTCEALAKEEKGFLLKSAQNQSADLFSIHDPYELRRAVVPVLLMGADGVMNGMGTAFHVDGMGTFVTADHVLHIDMPDFKASAIKTGYSSEYSPILLLGLGLVYGKVGVPNEAIASVNLVNTPINQKENPLDIFNVEPSHEAAVDLSIMHVLKPVPPLMNRTLPLSVINKPIKKGDIVVAIGYPDLDCSPVDDEGLRYLLKDGMSAAYGKIIDIHPYGRGSTTPIIEVEANWPSGMSGGPVLNIDGEVIGIVSKSIEPLGDLKGNGSAVCFGCLPKLSDWIPSLDFAQTGWRKGWAVINHKHSDLMNIYKTREEALAASKAFVSSTEITYCTNMIGTANYIKL